MTSSSGSAVQNSEARRVGFNLPERSRNAAIASNARWGGFRHERHRRTPPRMRERMLREISLHASLPSCAMQEGNFCSPENLYLKCVDFTETTPILGLKRFRIRHLDRCDRAEPLSPPWKA